MIDKVEMTCGSLIHRVLHCAKITTKKRWVVEPGNKGCILPQRVLYL